MKTKIIFLLIFIAFPAANIFAQNDSAEKTVRDFYKFHFNHEDSFDNKEISLRRRFLTTRLLLFFKNELKREALYHKKYPDNKAFFQGLGFTPEEFCPTGYIIGNAKVNRQKAIVAINFKSVCDQNYRDFIQYKIELVKIDGKWLIDNVIEDGGKTLIDAFREAKKIK